MTGSQSRAMRATHKGRTRRVQTSVVLLLLVCAACTPRGPFAGGPLSGKPGPAHVASWEFAADEEVLELETRPEDPRSVTLWFWADGPPLYVASSLIGGTKEPSERTWVAHITGNPRVRILIRGLIYERRARRVIEPSEYERARAGLERKYGLDPSARDPERSVWIFRLDPGGSGERSPGDS